MFCQRCGTEVPDNSSFCPSCGLDLGATTPLAAIQDPGRRTDLDVVRVALQDDYEIKGELGRGGMAIVYHGRERLLDREVAIKVLPFSLAHDQDFVERFQREAKTSAKLEHPHIVPVYRVGQKGDVIYFAMRYLRGKSLSEVIEEQGALEPAMIRQLLIESASALGYAHQHGIVHRDIKPDNIMFKENGQAVVCDFGIAKAASGTRLTGTGMAIGTPYYMSPEQARAQPLDGRSDLYSLGVVAYQCLTGSVPFDGEDSFAIGYKHIMEEVPEPDLKGDEDRFLFAIIQRMMAKDQNERFQTADDLVTALSGGRAPHPAAQLTGPGSPVASTAGKSAVARPTTPTTPMPRSSVGGATAGRRTVKKKSRTGVLVGAVVLVLAGVGGGAYAYVQFMGGPSSTASEGEGSPEDSILVPPPIDTTSLARNDSTGFPPDTAAPDTTTVADTSATVDSLLPPPVTTGTLILSGLGAGSRVWIDGTSVRGTTHELNAGRHEIRVERDGYRRFTQSFQVPAGRTARLPVRMQAIPVEPAPVVSQCESYDDTYNADGRCFDALPQLQDSPFVPLTSEIAGTPSQVTLLIEVRTDGSVGQVTLRIPSDDSQFTIAAINFARTLRYNPAQKDGDPVRALKQEVLLPGARQ